MAFANPPPAVLQNYSLIIFIFFKEGASRNAIEAQNRETWNILKKTIFNPNFMRDLCSGIEAAFHTEKEASIDYLRRVKLARDIY